MRLLLDTQLYLWFLANSNRLSRAARKQIDVADEVCVSAASIWEATIKLALGKLEVELEKLIEGITASGFKELPVCSGAWQITPLSPRSIRSHTYLTGVS